MGDTSIRAGQCHCGEVRFEMTLIDRFDSIRPRSLLLSLYAAVKRGELTPIKFGKTTLFYRPSGRRVSFTFTNGHCQPVR